MYPAILQPKKEHIEAEGNGAAVLAGTMFRVELDNNYVVLATICGKMRNGFPLGDRVHMEMSLYDLNKARITWRPNSSSSFWSHN